MVSGPRRLATTEGVVALDLVTSLLDCDLIASHDEVMNIRIGERIEPEERRSALKQTHAMRLGN